MCVGLNVHKGGGRNLQKMQINGYNEKECHKNDIYAYKYQPGVIDSLSGKKEGNSTYVMFEDGMKLAVERKHIEKKYRGTPLWYRIALYSKILLDGKQENIEKKYKELAEVYNRIIFMDVVKCSPDIDSAKPNSKELLIYNLYKNETM